MNPVQSFSMPPAIFLGWQDGGQVEVGVHAIVALHDLTGFEGRCEALLFCMDADFEPSSEGAALKALLNQPVARRIQ